MSLYLGKLRARIAQQETLYELFELQTQLIEHKFPHDFIVIHEFLISAAGDIYREMTRRWPHYRYIEEKWSTLQKYCSRPPGLTVGDWSALKELMQMPTYKAERDTYLEKLHLLKDITEKVKIDLKRKNIMLESLNMIEALIGWFESLNPFQNPLDQLDKLTDAIATYFPIKFWET